MLLDGYKATREGAVWLEECDSRLVFAVLYIWDVYYLCG